VTRYDRRLVLCFALFGACSKTSSDEAPPPATAPAWVEADTKKPLEPQLAEQADIATKAGHRPIAYLHAAWCEPCRAIDATRKTDEKMKAAFAPTHIISIDIDSANPAELAKLGLTSGAIPVFYRLDGAGHTKGEAIDGGAWGENIPDNMAPPLAAFFAK
jgi:thiol:disulfide interchange protein